MKEKIVILASGGLDSNVLIHLYHSLGYDVHLLYINHNNKNSKKELETLKNICKKLDIDRSKLEIAFTSFEWSSSGTLAGRDTNNYYVEMRNLVFLSMAISYAEAMGIGYIALGLIYNPKCDFADSTTSFLYKMENIAKESTGATVLAPLINADKTQVRHLAKLYGVDEWFTCFEPLEDGSPCNKCPACNVE